MLITVGADLKAKLQDVNKLYSGAEQIDFIASVTFGADLKWMIVGLWNINRRDG